MATALLEPGTKVRVKENLKNDLTGNQPHLLHDEYTIKEYDPSMQWYLMEEPWREAAPMFLFREEIEEVE